MANDSFQKILTLIIFISISFFSFSQDKQKKTNYFSDDFSLYIQEISDFMTKSDNQDLKIILNRYKTAVSNLSVNEQDIIIRISNKMLTRKLKPKQHFSKFLSSITITVNSSEKKDLLNWLRIVEDVVDQSTIKTTMLLFDFHKMLILVEAKTRFLRFRGSTLGGKIIDLGVAWRHLGGLLGRLGGI